MYLEKLHVELCLKHLDMGSRFLGHLNLLVNTLKTRRGGVQFLSHVFLCNLIFWHTLNTLLLVLWTCQWKKKRFVFCFCFLLWRACGLTCQHEWAHVRLFIFSSSLSFSLQIIHEPPPPIVEDSTVRTFVLWLLPHNLIKQHLILNWLVR